MERKRSIGLAIISTIEGLIGLFGLWDSAVILTYEMRTGNVLGMGLLMLPATLALSLFLLLSLGIALRKRIAWYAHMIFIPLILLSLFWFAKITNAFGTIVILLSVFGILTLLFLIHPNVKRQFVKKKEQVETK